jgi:hypothetical protein
MKFRSIPLIVVACVLSTACTKGLSPPKSGTPAFYWAEAQEAYRTGNLPKTDSALLKLVETENSFTAQARLWQLVVSGGLTQGFSELADSYQAGSLRALDRPLRFRNEEAKLRSAAATAGLEFGRAVHNVVNCKDESANVTLTFGFPPGSAVPPSGLLRISSGLWLSDLERKSITAAVLQRGVLRSVSAAVGFPDDPSKAQVLFRTPEVLVPREIFVGSMAKLLYEESNLFGPGQMYRPDLVTLMRREAVQALQSIPRTQDRNELLRKLQETWKGRGGV